MGPAEPSKPPGCDLWDVACLAADKEMAQRRAQQQREEASGEASGGGSGGVRGVVSGERQAGSRVPWVSALLKIGTSYISAQQATAVAKVGTYICAWVGLCVAGWLSERGLCAAFSVSLLSVYVVLTLVFRPSLPSLLILTIGLIMPLPNASYHGTPQQQRSAKINDDGDDDDDDNNDDDDAAYEKYLQQALGEEDSGGSSSDGISGADYFDDQEIFITQDDDDEDEGDIYGFKGPRLTG